jgi:ABC-2 type transport system permease protein
MIIGILTDWVKRSNKAERLWLLAKIEFKLRYYENKLGLLWALIKPLMDIAIYFVVFQVILRQNVPSFASYLFIGLIMWNFFLESTTGTVQILHTKKYLYEYSNMNKLEIYVSTILSNSIGFFFNFIMFVIFFNFIEKGTSHSNIHVLWMIPLFINLYILSLAISLILSNIFVIAKDITQIWQVFTSFLFFLSPIFYKLDIFQTRLPNFDYLNPIAGVIINARKATMEGVAPDLKLFVWDLAYATILLFLGIYLLNKLGSKAAEKL